MPDPQIPQEILVIAMPQPAHSSDDYDDMEQRRGPFQRRQPPSITPVQITELNTQINIFLGQLGEMMKDTPPKVGEFKMDEFEVSVAIVAGVKGEVSLALLASAEASGEVSAGIKFVFKRSAR